MPRWSKLQDAVLWEHGHEGAERCAAIIGHRFGVARTPEAVRRHAYRIGAPIIAYEVCPRCGARVDHLSPHGTCYACSRRELAEAQRCRNDALRAELRANAPDGAAGRKADREYAAERAKAHRLRKRIMAG